MTLPAASRVLIGTASWGADYGIANRSRLEAEEIPELVRIGASGGFSGFDFAQDYLVPSRLFAAARGVELFSKLSHKIGLDSAERIRENLKSDLKEMCRDSFDGMAIHSVHEFFRAPRDATRVMEDLKELGLIKSWGISLYTLEECREVFRFASPDYIQAPVSAVDARFTKPATLELFSQRGTVLHGRSIYLQGALLMSPETLPPYLRTLSPILTHFRDLAKCNGMELANFLLNYVAGIEGVSRLVVGVNSARQLIETSRFLRADPGELPGLPPEFIFTNDDPILDPRGWGV